jgi:hypothetical protein
MNLTQQLPIATALGNRAMQQLVESSLGDLPFGIGQGLAERGDSSKFRETQFRNVRGRQSCRT